ncbi:MAG: YbhB/YbcL family Raf kinase inhibitor-like protein [Acidimicrobiia bacterium]|nr:YbhB/YbcL family Raf kinase inhibitor-like protein [Acidimicrobiia bacterium]
MRRVRVLGVATLLLVGSCGGTGSSGEDTAGGDDPGTTAAILTLTSPAFADGDPIPDEYAAAGRDRVTTAVVVRGPPDTEELAFSIVDPDADNFVHWIVAGIDPATTGIAAGEVPDGAVQAMSNFGEPRYAGPAPPPGPRHTYLFTLYALPEPSGITHGMASDEPSESSTTARPRPPTRGEFGTE